MPGWLIILLVFIVGGAILGLISSADKSSGVSGPQGCLGGALMGGIGGMGCLGAILEWLLPIILAILLFSWLFNGCS